MSGNVWEWVWDWYGNAPCGPYRSFGLRTAPSWGATSGSVGAVLTLDHGRVSFRDSNTPAYAFMDIGARLVRSAE